MLNVIKSLDDWWIPVIILVGWIAFIFSVIHPILKRLKKKAEQNNRTFNLILLFALATPLLIFLLGLGLGAADKAAIQRVEVPSC